MLAFHFYSVGVCVCVCVCSQFNFLKMFLTAASLSVPCAECCVVYCL